MLRVCTEDRAPHPHPPGARGIECIWKLICSEEGASCTVPTKILLLKRYSRVINGEAQTPPSQKEVPPKTNHKTVTTENCKDS